MTTPIKYFQSLMCATGKLMVLGLLLSMAVMALPACNKLVEVPSPTTSLTSENVYKNDVTAAAVMTGIYTSMSGAMLTNGYSLTSMSLLGGLSADELTLHGGGANANTMLSQYYLNNITPGNSISAGNIIWKTAYQDIYTINLSLERLQLSTGLTPAVKRQLMGEAKFMRAFNYFYLTALYKDVPLALSSDYRTNTTIPKSSQAKVFEMIIADLEEAKTLLNDKFVSADAKTQTAERTRPSRWSATALLARTYLYKQNWAKVEEEAAAVINNGAVFALDSLNGVFLKNSKETIWQLQPVMSGWNTEDAKVFILPATGPTSIAASGGFPVYLSDRLVNAFESGDQRKDKWTSSVTVNTATGPTVYKYAYKYKSATLNAAVTEYASVLRLGEIMLIRAEARARQDKLNEALADVNLIRVRAGLQPLSNLGKDQILAAIYHERQIELFSEWGHRWLDLKRTGKVDEVMSIVAAEKGGSWNTHWQWYPLPLYDIVRNPNLIQNDGY